MLGNFGLGWIKDPPDQRDYNVRSLIPPEKKVAILPDKYTVYPDTIIYNQGSTSECVAHALSGVKTDQEYLQYAQRYEFDAHWLYTECKKADSIPTIDGTYPRVACQILQERGTIMVGEKRCFAKQVLNIPDAKWKINSYFRIDSTNTNDDIKQLLFTCGSFLAASRWYSNWSEKFAVFSQPNGIVSGGHAFRIIGWNTVGWVVANSWGKLLWGNWGIATMPYKMFQNYVLVDGDSWKIVDQL